jgi:hypothetical protein
MASDRESGVAGSTRSVPGVVLGLLAAAVLTLAGCSSNSSANGKTPTTPTTPTTAATTPTTAPTTQTTALNPASARSKVSAAFTTLFDAGDSDVTAKVALLQDPARYKAKFTALYSSSEAQQNPTTAKVVTVTFPGTSACQSSVQSPVCAKVLYDLDTATTGASLLANQTGYAIYTDGKWLVSDDTFCVLAGLAGQKC